MEVKQEHKDFLLNEVPKLLDQLKADVAPRFGLMTAQHMVEHLTWTTKIVTKRKGEVENPPTKGQIRFKQFINEYGAIFKYRSSDKTKADLPALRYDDFEEAKAGVTEAIERFYNHFDAHPDFKCYNAFMGELTYGELSLQVYQHVRYHFYQFHLLEQYP